MTLFKERVFLQFKIQSMYMLSVNLVHHKSNAVCTFDFSSTVAFFSLHTTDVSRVV